MILESAISLLIDSDINSQKVMIANNASGPRSEIYSVSVDPKGCALVNISAQFEVTNPYKFNVGLGRYIAKNGNKHLSPAMDNVTPDMHHKVVNLSSSDVIKEPTTYSVVAYAASYRAKPVNYLLIHELGELRLSIINCEVSDAP